MEPTEEDDNEPGAGWKLLRHFVQEMSWPMLFALGIVSFFFFFGVTNSLVKLTGRDVASVDFPIGPVVGAICGVLVIILGAMLKLNHRE